MLGSKPGGRRFASCGAVLLVFTSLACDQPAGPTAPGVGQLRDVIVGGSVFEPLGGGIAGASVSVAVRGEAVMARGATNASGSFRIPVTAPVAAYVDVTVAGDRYQAETKGFLVDATRPLGSPIWTLRPVEPITLAARYRVTIVAAETCPALPPGFGVRTYDATWTQDINPTRGRLTLAGRFAGDHGSAYTTTGLDQARFDFYRPLNGDEERIAELVGERSFYGLYGSATAPFHAAKAVNELPLSGELEFCREANPASTSTACLFGSITCRSNAHRLRLERQ